MRAKNVRNPTLQDTFDIWKTQKIADYSTLTVTKKIYEDIDNATRLKLRNEHLKWQLKKIRATANNNIN